PNRCALHGRDGGPRGRSAILPAQPPYRDELLIGSVKPSAQFVLTIMPIESLQNAIRLRDRWLAVVGSLEQSCPLSRFATIPARWIFSPWGHLSIGSIRASFRFARRGPSTSTSPAANTMWPRIWRIASACAA